MENEHTSFRYNYRFNGGLKPQNRLCVRHYVKLRVYEHEVYSPLQCILQNTRQRGINLISGSRRPMCQFTLNFCCFAGLS